MHDRAHAIIRVTHGFFDKQLIIDLWETKLGYKKGPKESLENICSSASDRKKTVFQ